MVGAQLAGPIWESNTDFLVWFAGGLLLMIGAVVLTVMGIVRAGGRGDTAWLVGICAAFFFGFSWLVALIYLLQSRTPSVQRTPTEMGAAPTPRFCMQCGKAVVSGARFCMECGTKIQVPTYRPFR